MGTTKAALRSCVKPFAKPTYSVTTSQVMHAPLLFPLAAIFLFLILMNGANAQTGEGIAIRKADFFDLEFAKSVWTGTRTIAAYDALDKKYCKPEDKELRKAFYKPQWNARLAEINAARDAIRKHPDADRLKKCIDVDLIYYKWFWMSDAAFRSIKFNGSDFNTLPTDRKVCRAIAEHNYFTGQCNDLPDWRTPKSVEAWKNERKRYKPRS